MDAKGLNSEVMKELDLDIRFEWLGTFKSFKNVP